jgi:hypothetical protein
MQIEAYNKKMENIKADIAKINKNTAIFKKDNKNS